MRMTLKRFRHNGPCLLFVAAILCINLIKNVHSVPQQIFIPGLNIANSNSNNHRQQFASQQQQPIAAPQQASSPYQPQKQQPEKKAEFPFNLNDLQINDLFNMLNNPSKSQQHHQEKSFPAESVFLTETMDPSHVVNMMTTNLDESATLKPFMARPEMLEQHNNDIERYFNKAMSSPYDTISTNDDGLTMTDPSPMSSHSSSSSSSSQDDYDLSTSSTSTTTQTSTTSETTTDETSTTTSSTTTTTETTTTTTTTTTTSTTTTTLAPSSSQRYVTATLPATTRHVAAAAYLGNLKKQDAASSNDYKMKSQMNKLSQMAPMTQQVYASNMNDYLYKKQQQQLNDYSLPNGGRITFNGNLNGGNFDVKSLLAKKDSPQIQQQQQQQLPSLVQMSSNYRDCSDNRESKTADEKYCNLFHSCVNGVYQAMLCPEGYLFSTMLQKCDRKMNVECGKRIALDFDRTNIPHDDYMNDYYSAAPSPRIINGSLECTLGLDGYFADPEFCNIYHHCLAGVDYAVQCPQQLVWNDKKKMCDWQTSVNCTGRIIPVAQGQTSFCTDKADNKYADSVYCNVFHHCVGGIDNVVRCDEELQWNDKDKKCDWEGKVHCTNKMLPSEKHYNSTFCIGKPDGPYAHEEYCNVYHVCESGTDNIRQCPNQLFWDYKTKRCDWSGNVECTGRTLITISTDTTLFCMERRDGVYGDPIWCNVYHNCLSGVDFKTKCPAGLIWNETKKDCDWSDSTQCSTGNLLKDSTDVDKITFCTDKPNGKYPHELHCNRYYVCQNGKDIIFTCQNNLRYNATKQECDWAANVNCFGKQDYMWEGIKESFCKNKPDGNYPDSIYCNIFHQCQAATDYPKRCSNRLMFNEDKGECDWEDQVDCKGKEKLIETSGLQDESKPETSGDGKGRVTKFCMVKENGNYADLYYCNVYHNCHGGFDTVQYCANGLVWRQDTPVSGTCDWPLSAKMNNGVDCGNKKTFMIDKQSQVDIMATLRSDFCITRGEGLFAHTKYCDLYIHCTAQAVAITMECSPGLIFNEQKRECDYLSDDQLAMLNNTYCSPPKTVLRPKPKADGTLMFNGNDVTGKFPTKFTCEQKPQQLMHNDDDWCNIYHVCAGPRDNIFICPPGTVFSKEKQGCFDRYTQQSCSGSINYYKPNLKKPSSSQIPSYPGSGSSSGGYGSGSSSGGYGSGSSSGGYGSGSSSGGYGSGSGSSGNYGSIGGGILGGNQIIVVPTPSSPASMGNFEFVYPSSGGSSSGSSYQNSYLQPSYGSNVYSNSGSSSGSSSGGPNPYSSSNQYLHNYNSNYNMGYN